MKRIIILSSLAVLILTAVLAVVYFYRNSEKNRNELLFYGNVDVREVDMGFRVPGQVTRLFFEEGDEVAEGSLVAVLDRTPYDSQVTKAKADMAAITAKLINAEILLERRIALIKIGGVSQEDLDDALASRNTLAADLKAAEAALVVTQDNLSYTEIYAPTDGIILTRIREPGTVVNPADPVYTLSVISPVWIRAYVNEPELSMIYYGMPAEIYTDTQKDTEGGPTYIGQIGFISPVAEFTPKTVETTRLRTDLVYRIRVYANNPDRYLKQGMPVTVKVRIDPWRGQPERKRGDDE